MNTIIIKLIQFYKKRISPNTNPHCKYSPTCSSYALECFYKFNFFKALFLSVFRILRCNPISKGGYDPVPLSRIEKQIKIAFDVTNIKPVTSLKS